jgi:prepilin-type N-terminal cleavage/methylation domain-containing protein
MTLSSAIFVSPSPRSPIRPFSHPRKRRAFTLIEVLVVVFIALIASAIAVPSFVRAMQGQRLRTSARAVVTAHKYARNMAVLRQTPMALLFDRLGQQIELVSLQSRESLAGRNMFMDTRTQALRDAAPPKPEFKEDGEEKAPPSIASEETRKLESDVKIDDFSSEGDVAERDGVYWVNYYPSGMSDGFTLKLVDERRRVARIKTDAISGIVEVEYE